MSLLKTALLSAVAAVCIAPSVSAAPVVTLTSPGLIYGSGQYTLGFEFSVKSNQTATQLGVYDQGGASLSGDAQVGLWDTSGNLLTSVTVLANGGSVINDFRYASINPFLLTTGVDYVVGAFLSTGSATSLNTNQGGTGFYNPSFNIIEDRFSNFNSAFSFPDRTDNHLGGAWLGANINVGTVPLPASAPMFGAALLALGAVSYGMKRKGAAAA